MELFDLLNESGITTAEQPQNLNTEIQRTALLEELGLDWTVKKEKLSLPNGLDSGFSGIVRQDNNLTFGTCKDGYETFQNSELLELIGTAANNLGLEIKNGGFFKGGATTFLQIETGAVKGIGENNDVVNKYVTGMNSHDGSLSLRWGMNNTVLSCSNQFYQIANSLQNTVKHTASMRSKISEIMRSIEAVQEEEQKLFDIYFKLANAEMSNADINNTFQNVLKIDLNEKEKTLTAYQKNRFTDLSNCIAGETRQKGKTLWGLFNGVTKYTTHYIPGGTENRKQSKAIGNAYKLDNKVLTQLTAVVA